MWSFYDSMPVFAQPGDSRSSSNCAKRIGLVLDMKAPDEAYSFADFFETVSYESKKLI